MNGVKTRRTTRNNGHEEAHSLISQCCLCCQLRENCIDLSSVVPTISIDYISQNVGVQLMPNEPNRLCQQCIVSLTTWQKFVSNCLEAQ